jgi:hypothetical protein
MGGSHSRPGNSLGLVSRSPTFGFVGGFGGAGYGGGWGAWFPGYPNDPYGYETGRVPTPPYFAIHPPVYYGKRVGMPYGNSTVTRPPRAVVDYQPSVQHVVHVRQPAMILNPFAGTVSQAAEAAPAPEPAEVAQAPAARADEPLVEKRQKRSERSKKAKGSSRSQQKNRKSSE